MQRGAWGAASILVLALGLDGCSKPTSSAADADAGVAVVPVPAGVVNPLAFLNGFEGEIGLSIQQPSKTPNGTSIPVSLQIKNDVVRADIPPGLGPGARPDFKGHVVLNTPQKKLYLVMDEQKQVIVVDLAQAGEQLKSLGPRPGAPKPGAPSRPPPTVTKTGVMDKVAGYSCENWDVSEETRKVASLCIADQGASWFHLPLTGLPSEYAWALELMDGKHFPMRAIAYKDGSEQGRVEVSKLEKKALASTLFEIPPGYKTVDLASMMQGMGAGMGAARMPPGFHPGVMPPVGHAPKRVP